MSYKINDLIKIEAYNHNGNPKLIIFLKSEKQGIEADYIEFDYERGAFSVYTYR